MVVEGEDTNLTREVTGIVGLQNGMIVKVLTDHRANWPCTNSLSREADFNRSITITITKGTLLEIERTSGKVNLDSGPVRGVTTAHVLENVEGKIKRTGVRVVIPQAYNPRFEVLRKNRGEEEGLTIPVRLDELVKDREGSRAKFCVIKSSPRVAKEILDIGKIRSIIHLGLQSKTKWVELKDITLKDITTSFSVVPAGELSEDFPRFPGVEVNNRGWIILKSEAGTFYVVFKPEEVLVSRLN